VRSLETHGLADRVVEPDRRAAELDERARRDDRALDANRTDVRAVRRAEIGHRDTARPHGDLEVVARDREVADDQCVVARGPDRHDVAADHVLAAIRTVDDLDAHRRDDLLAGSRLKQCLLTVHESCSCCAHRRSDPTIPR
jgi:hypothetical protein